MILLEKDVRVDSWELPGGKKVISRLTHIPTGIIVEPLGVEFSDKDNLWAELKFQVEKID